MLNDKQIKKEIELGYLKITPEVLDENIQPVSIDLHLGNILKFYATRAVLQYGGVIDFRNPANVNKITNSLHEVDLNKTNQRVLQPQQFILGSTVENFVVPSHLAGKLEGKSTLGRVGLVPHCTAGFVDPGFQGSLTLEIVNHGVVPVVLYPNMPIAQITFYQIEEPENSYAGKYSGSESPVGPVFIIPKEEE